MSHVATYALLLFCAFLHYTWCSGLVPASNNSNLPASNPTHGANMGWHQDGYNQGVYIAHYYLIGDNCEVENTAMDWFEIALPPPLPATDGDVGENYSVELLNGVLDQARIIASAPEILWHLRLKPQHSKDWWCLRMLNAITARRSQQTYTRATCNGNGDVPSHASSSTVYVMMDSQLVLEPKLC